MDDTLQGPFCMPDKKQKSAPHHHRPLGAKPRKVRCGRYGKDFMGIDGVGQIFQVTLREGGRSQPCVLA